MIFNAQNWYWIVGGSTTQVYSSAAGDYVAVNDATYVVWLTAGGLPTQIASEVELGEVLSAYSLRPAAANVLDGYQDTQAKQITIAVVAKILLWLVNQVLVLKGQSALNAVQFRAFIKGLL